MSSSRGTLVERDRELQELDRLVRGALEGQAMLALVEGPAGIGKSRLLAAAREKAAGSGFRVGPPTGVAAGDPRGRSPRGRSPRVGAPAIPPDLLFAR